MGSFPEGLYVFTAYDVISHVQADSAHARDSRYLPTIVQQVQQRLARNELQLQDPVADPGYSNGFTYHETADEYRCRADKTLPFRKYRLSADGN
ncbi:hypothetical protein GCM10027346_42240 [Hymenobacter seoulensis]